MAKKPKDLLRKEVLKLDNHHPLIPLDWNDKTIHVHKRMIVNDHKGRNIAVSATLNLNDRREVKVTYDDPKHTKMKKKEEDSCRRQIINEINECLEDPKEAAAFVDHIYDEISSLSSKDEKLTPKRMNEAFDNVMDALGIPTDKKASIKKANGKILSLYLTGDYPNDDHVSHIKNVHKSYRNHYHQDIREDYPLYFAAYEDKKLVLGEYSPASALYYAYKGYKTWVEPGEVLSQDEIKDDEQGK